jgi:YHS domain-containing protein
MKKVILTAVILGLVGVFGSFADEKADNATTKELKQQTVCPVMGGKINKKFYVDTDAGRIYVCCQECINAIKKNPAKYIEKLKAEGIQIEKVPEKTDAGHEDVGGNKAGDDHQGHQ